MYKYYALERPIGIGSVPSGLIDHINYEGKENVKNTNIKAWGEVYYEKKLSPEQIKSYGLKEEKSEKEIKKALKDINFLDEIYLKIIQFEPNDEKLHKPLDLVSNYINNEIKKMLDENLISYEKYKELSFGCEEEKEGESI